jgi:hypothetical protein
MISTAFEEENVAMHHYYFTSLIRLEAKTMILSMNLSLC